MAAMLPRRHVIAFVLLLVLALGLRTVGLSHLVYANPDEALWSYFIVTTAQLSPISPRPAENSLARILSWDYGYPLFVVDYAYVRALEMLGLPVSEATLPLPLAVLGTLTCLLVYLIVQRFVAGPPSALRASTPQLVEEVASIAGGSLARQAARAVGNPPAGSGAHGATPAAFIAAALMAVMPLTVGRSRSIGGAEAASGFLFLLALLQLMQYWERSEDRRRQWLAGLCVGLYLCADVQFSVGGAVLLGFVLLWPRAQGYEGWRGLGQLLWRPGVLVPPLVLFLPYVPAWLYAIKLGYPDQTYLGTVFAEHHADWGFHLVSFVKDLARNMGIAPAIAAVFALPWLVVSAWKAGPAKAWPLRRPALRWLLVWIGLTALPFLFFVTGQVTQVSGYHEHLVAALAVGLGLAVGQVRRPLLQRGLAGMMVTGALFVTLGGVLRVGPLVPLWPDTTIPYGGLVPNSGMKTAGYWVRQNLPPGAQVFVAHDPAVAYWYMGRECITGGLVAQAQRKQALLANAARIAAAVIPDQREAYPSALMRALGLPGHVVVRHNGAEVLDIRVRQELTVTLDTARTDPLYDAAYRTSRAIIPPPWPYAPGKPVRP